MLFLYYCIVLLILVVAGPLLLFNKRARTGIRQKLGIVPVDFRERLTQDVKPVWFHAVSVGEFNAAWPVIDRLHRKHPEKQIVISTTTATGQKLACERAGAFAQTMYFPFDLPWSTGNWLDAICPSLVVIVETELWPCFLKQCSQRQIPVMVINGRMSPRSFESYLRWKAFFGPVIRKYALILAQSESESQRYKAIAGNALPIKVVGNLKFDQVVGVDNEKKNELIQRLNITGNNLVFVAGSTHEGEETALLKAYRALIRSHIPSNKSQSFFLSNENGQSNSGSHLHLMSNLRFIIAPRHPERFNRVAGLIEQAGFCVKRFSRHERLDSSDEILLVDTIGHLSSLYSIADLAFVGGTLVPVGGHNLAEPYAYSIPVICGPYVHKTQDVAFELSNRNAISILKDTSHLVPKLTELFSDSELRKSMGATGNRWLLENAGAVGKTLALIESVLSKLDRSGTAKIEALQ